MFTYDAWSPSGYDAWSLSGTARRPRLSYDAWVVI